MKCANFQLDRWRSVGHSSNQHYSYYLLQLCYIKGIGIILGFSGRAADFFWFPKSVCFQWIRRLSFSVYTIGSCATISGFCKISGSADFEKLWPKQVAPLELPTCFDQNFSKSTNSPLGRLSWKRSRGDLFFFFFFFRGDLDLGALEKFVFVFLPIS